MADILLERMADILLERMADILLATALGFIIIMVMVGTSVVLAQALLTDKRGRWPWDESRRLDEELQRAQARVQFAEEGMKLRRREEAARRALEKRKKRDG